MTKEDLKLIHAFIDSKNPKNELNFALVSSGGIFATDTRKAIHFNHNFLGADMLLHKKVLNGFIQSLDKHDVCDIDGCGFLHNGDIKVNCDTFYGDENKFPNLKAIIDHDFKYMIKLDNIDDLQFELSLLDCFIDEVHLNPIIEFSSICHEFIIFYDKQTVIDGLTNNGMVKIVGLYNEDEELGIVRFNAMVMGREFKAQAKEQLLFEL